MGDDEAALVEKIIFKVAEKEKRVGQKAIEKLEVSIGGRHVYTIRNSG